MSADLEETVDDGSNALRARAASLDVTGGPDAGRSARLDRPVLIVGTGPAADLRLSDDTVSRVHLRMTLSSDGVHVRDAGSRNGTWLGAARIESALLVADAVLRLGTSTISVRIDKEVSPVKLHPRDRFGDAIGLSDAMRHTFALLERAAESDMPVLIEGEPGVGKDTLARAVHEASARRDGAFVTADCAGLSAALLEDELFGHEPGAFEDTGKERAGAFELAHGGTLVLEEVGALPLELQGKLAHALAALGTKRSGSSSLRPFDVRLVSTSQRSLADLAASGLFQQDLYQRLSVVRVQVLPLRDRPDDVLPIGTHFLRDATGDEHAALPPELASMLVAYRWPGNVRELRNVVLRFATLGVRDRDSLFGTGSFGERRGLPSLEELGQLGYHEARQTLLERFEDMYIPTVLERAGGVVSKAAELAGVARPSFYRMVDRQRSRASSRAGAGAETGEQDEHGWQRDDRGAEAGHLAEHGDEPEVE